MNFFHPLVKHPKINLEFYISNEFYVCVRDSESERVIVVMFACFLLPAFVLKCHSVAVNDFHNGIIIASC